MARPKKQTEILSRRFPTVQCTEEDLAIIHRNAEQAGMGVSQYVRHVVLSSQVVVRESRFDFQTAEELRRIGVNINQQTKALNATGVMPIELRRLWGKLEAILDGVLTHA